MKKSILFLSFVLVGNFYWVYLNSAAPFFDAAGHTTLAMVYANLYRGIFENLVDPFYLGVSTYYPPLLYYVSGALLLIDFHFKTLQYFSILLFGVSALFIYWYALLKTKKHFVASTAMVMYIFLPITWDQSRQFMLDIPLTLFLFASLVFLGRSKGFTKPFYSLMFIIFASFAQLTKWYAVVYLSVPVLFALFYSLKSKRLSVGHLVSLVVFVLMAATLVLPWYIVNFDTLIRLGVQFTGPDFGDPTNLISLANIFYYPVVLVNHQIVSIQFVIFIIGIVLAIRLKTKASKQLLVQIIFLYIFFTFVLGNKNLRYIIPALPFLLLYAALGLDSIKKEASKLLLFGIYILFSIFIFITNSFIKTDMGMVSVKLIHSLPELVLFNFSGENSVYSYQDIEVGQSDVVSYLVDSTTWPPTDVLVVSNSQFLSVAGLQAYSMPTQFELHFVNYIEVPLDLERSLHNSDIENYLSSFDYVIVAEKGVGPENTLNYNNMNVIRDYVLAGSNREYYLIKKFNFTDLEEVYLLKRGDGGNKLIVDISKGSLQIERENPYTKIYIQFMDQYFNWEEIVIDSDLSEANFNTEEYIRFRVDYPPNLLQIQLTEDWVYDGDKQFDRKDID